MPYRPLLRWKRGEQNAITNLSAQLKQETVPLLTLTGHAYNPALGTTTDPAFDARIVQDAERLRTAWSGFRISVDFAALDPDAECAGGVHPVNLFLDVINRGVDVRPVVRPNSDARLIEAIAGYDTPPTFRLTPDDLADPSIGEIITSQLEVCAATPNECDVVVDMSFIATAGRSIITAQGALAAVPFRDHWETVTLASGSFPENLSQYAVGSHLVQRIEWDVWQAVRIGASREILYGDYATIHPIPVEDGLDPRTMNPSASVRYTFEGSWLLVRGEGTRNRGGLGFGQFLNHADLIVHRPEYRGAAFSYGDEKIARIHRREDGAGNLETWVTIGVNHHIAELVGQLANLP